MGDLSIEQIQSRLDILTPAMYSDAAFRELLAQATAAARIYIIRKLTDVPLHVRLPALMVMVEKPDHGLEKEASRLLQNMPRVDRDSVVNQLLSSDAMHQRKMGIDFAREFSIHSVMQRLKKMWPSTIPATRIAIVSCLASFNMERADAIAVGFIAAETNPEVIAAILEKLNHYRVQRKHRIFERYLDHSDDAVRLQAAKGLTVFGKSHQTTLLRSCLAREKSYRIRDLLMTGIRPFANEAYAAELMDWAVSHDDPELNSLATLQFRQLSDEQVYIACKRVLESGDDRHQAFAIAELGFLEIKEAGDLLRQIAADRAQSGLLRGAAVEGLSHHHHMDARQFLVELFRDEAGDPYFGYQICLTLIKLWRQDDMPAIGSFLRLQEPDYSVHLQTILSFLAKKMKARKLNLSDEVTALIHNHMDSENANIQMLALEVLSYQPEAAELERLLILARSTQSEEAIDLLENLIGATVARTPDAFAACVVNGDRPNADRSLAMRGAARAHGTPDGLAAAFLALCEAALELPEELLPDLGKALHHLADMEGVVNIVKLTLPGWSKSGYIGFWKAATQLTADHLDALVTDVMYQRIDTLEPEQRLLAIKVVARIRTTAAKNRVMAFYFDYPDYRASVIASLHQAIREAI